MPNVLSTVAHPPATAARRRRDWRSVRLLIPALLLLVIFFLLPVLSLLLRSVLEPSPGLHNYAQLVGSTDYLRVFGNTFLVATVVTLATLAIGFPTAWLLAIAPRKLSSVFFAILLLSMWTNLLARTFAWMVLLQQTGPINRMLMALGIISEPLTLVNNLIGVTIGMTYIMLPFLVMPLHATLRGIDPSTLRTHRAARAATAELGSRWRRRFRAARRDALAVCAATALHRQCACKSGRPIMLLDFDRLGALRWALLSIGAAVALFLLLPIVFIVALSFGDSQWLIFPPPGWTLEWYRQLFTDAGWIDSLLTSAKLAVIVTVLSVLIGFLASLALVRGKFRGRNAVQAFFLTPMVLPVVVLAVALYAFFLRIGLNGTITGFVIGHLIIALPFSIISISNSLASFDTALEDAALICGASPLEVKLRVTLPAIRLGIFAAAIFSFLASWDEVVVSIFMASPTLQTLPVRIWATLRQDLTPVVAAASSLLVGLTAVLMLAGAVLRRAR